MNRNDLILEIREQYERTAGGMNERQRRLWAATEAIKLGRGGIAAISKALRISPNTIRKGILELTAAEEHRGPDEKSRVRRAGGGRKPNKN